MIEMVLRDPLTKDEIKEEARNSLILLAAFSVICLAGFWFLGGKILNHQSNGSVEALTFVGWLILFAILGVVSYVVLTEFSRLYPVEIGDKEKNELIEFLDKATDRQTRNEVADYLAKVRMLDRPLMNIEFELLKKWVDELSKRELEHKYRASFLPSCQLPRPKGRSF